MTDLKTLIPADAVEIANTPDYTAWASEDGADFWIIPKDEGTNVTDAMASAVMEQIFSEGKDMRRLFVPNQVIAMDPEAAKRTDLQSIDIYLSDFGTVDVRPIFKI